MRQWEFGLPFLFAREGTGSVYRHEIMKEVQIMRKSRLIKGAALLLASVMVMTGLTACGKDPGVEETTAATTAAAGGTTAAGNDGAAETADTSTGEAKSFTYAIGGDPGSNVNVITTSDRYGLMTIKMVYSPLFMYNADGINWFLASSMDTSEDNLTYTFHLRDDVKWSDGEPFTADDVVFTYEAMASVENSWAYSQLVYPEGKVEIKKIDDYTVSFSFPFVNASSVEMLSQIFIMPEHVYAGVTDFENNEFNVNPVGTGPYVLSEYSAGSYVKFSRNNNYYFGAPDIDTIIFRIIENSNTAMLALQSGEINAWIGTPGEVQQMDLEGNNLTVYPYSEGRVGYLQINARNVPDERVRKAVLYALNKKEINDACFLSEDNYDTPVGFMPPNSQFYTEDVEKYDQDLEKSKSLLEEAGVTNLKLNMGYNGADTVSSTQAVMIQEQLKKAGIELTLTSADGNALFKQTIDPENTYDMYLGGYIMGIDPDTFASLFESGAVYNSMHYDYPEINDLFAEGRAATDTDKRKEIYTTLQQMIQDTGCFYPITSNKRLLVMSNAVTGVEEAKLVPVYTFEDTSKLQMK